MSWIIFQSTCEFARIFKCFYCLTYYGIWMASLPTLLFMFVLIFRSFIICWSLMKTLLFSYCTIVSVLVLFHFRLLDRMVLFFSFSTDLSYDSMYELPRFLFDDETLLFHLIIKLNLMQPCTLLYDLRFGRCLPDFENSDYCLVVWHSYMLIIHFLYPCVPLCLSCHSLHILKSSQVYLHPVRSRWVYLFSLHVFSPCWLNI